MKKDKSILFLEKIETAISLRLKHNWKIFNPNKRLATNDLKNLITIKLAAVLSWGEVFAQDVKNKKVEAPNTHFKNENEYIEWFLDQFENYEYLKDLKEVKDIFAGNLQEE